MGYMKEMYQLGNKKSRLGNFSQNKRVGYDRICLERLQLWLLILAMISTNKINQ